jgi:hypothetical protein
MLGNQPGNQGQGDQGNDGNANDCLRCHELPPCAWRWGQAARGSVRVVLDELFGFSHFSYGKHRNTPKRRTTEAADR